MELIFAIGLFVLVFAGLGLGLMLAGKPPQTSCGGLSCVGGGRCEAFPRRAAAETGDE
jgi:hypothetical protein